MKRDGSIQQRHNDRGFSLVEVLVGVAVLAIFCIPLFRGFRISAVNNNRAHHTQEATAYAQKTLEAVKSMRIDVDGAMKRDGTILTQLEECIKDDSSSDIEVDFITSVVDAEAKRDAFTDYQGNDDYTGLFTAVGFKQENIIIGGRTYNLEVEMDPLPYSKKQTVGTNYAEDANVYAASQVSDVDGMNFPLIADEINQYDSSIQATFLERARTIGHATAFAEGEKSIYSGLIKKVIVDIVDISSGSSANSILVICDVKYEIDYNYDGTDYNLTQTYNVYTGRFDLDCGKECEDEHPEEDMFSGWKKGGNIYIFAKAYRDNTGASYASSGDGRISGNEIEIKSNYIGNHPLDVFLVRGHYADGESVNFNSVNITVNGTNYCYYSTVPDTSIVLAGEERYEDIQFHTNIKGMLSALRLDPSEKEQTIGKEEPKLRSYEVRVRLIETESGKTAASVTSTKRVS